MMKIIIFWLIGWFIFSIGYYIYDYIANRDDYSNKKILAYRSFIAGSISWIGIIFCVAFIIVGCILWLDKFIISKLS